MRARFIRSFVCWFVRSLEAKCHSNFPCVVNISLYASMLWYLNCLFNCTIRMNYCEFNNRRELSISLQVLHLVERIAKASTMLSEKSAFVAVADFGFVYKKSMHAFVAVIPRKCLAPVGFLPFRRHTTTINQKEHRASGKGCRMRTIPKRFMQKL